MSVCQSPTPGVYTCQECNALFTCLDYYQQHRRNHAECNGIKLLTCSHCPYSTDNLFHYNWHIMSHSKQPAHRCQVCSKPQPQQLSATLQLKQEPIHNVSDSISDDEPSACAMAGKRSVATATTDDDLLLSTNLQSPQQQQQHHHQQQQQHQQQQHQSSCRMKSTGIMTSFSDTNNFFNLKTIDPSDLNSSEGEEEDDDEEEEEEDEEEEEEDGDEEEGEEVTDNQKNGENESEGDEEEEEDDEDDDEEEDDDEDDDEEEEQTEEFGVSVEPSVQNNSSNNLTNNLFINNNNNNNNNNNSNNMTNITNNNNTNSTKRVKTSDQTGTDGNTKPRGRGKGNRKSRVNVFFDGADGQTAGVEGIRRKFHCSHCGNGKSFKTKSHLQRHILTHTGEKPYHCNRCGSKFNQSSSLRNHIIAIHTKEYPHYCPNCGKGFLMPALLQKHLATSHRNK